MVNKRLQDYRFKMGTFSYDSLNLLAGCIKLAKLTTDSLSQIRLDCSGRRTLTGLNWFGSHSIGINRMNICVLMPAGGG